MTNVLLGTVIGDALGVPFEGSLSNNPNLLNWDGKTFLPSYSHQLQAGQYSDDGQMSLMVAESLIYNQGFNPTDLSARYVDWIASGTAKGYGRTTLAAIQNLQSGKSYRESGIVGSYGNGTAMRAAPFGVYFRNDFNSLLESVKIDNAITHHSEEAEAGALAIAIASFYAVNKDLDDLLIKICHHLPDSKVKNTISSLDAMINSEITPAQALRVLGTRADVRQTVPSALYCFMKFGSFSDAIRAAIRAGGDTDTTAAITGALFGARLGLQGISSEFYAVQDFDHIIRLDSQLYLKPRHEFFPRA